MRDELHLMELVDRYLDGSMNAEERKAFEARANANTELRQLIEDQRALREGVSRLPVRAAAAKAYRSYRLGKPGPWIGGVTLSMKNLFGLPMPASRPRGAAASPAASLPRRSR